MLNKIIAATVLGMALGLSSPGVAAVSEDETGAEAIASQILGGLPDACPSEEAMLTAIEQAAVDQDIAEIGEALTLVMSSREWCASARDTLQAAAEAAQVVMAANAATETDSTGGLGSGARGYTRQADPPGGNLGAAYGN